MRFMRPDLKTAAWSVFTPSADLSRIDKSLDGDQRSRLRRLPIVGWPWIELSPLGARMGTTTLN